MGGNPQNNGIENEKGCKYDHRLPLRHQAQKASECGCDSFSASEVMEQRENMPNHRGSDDQCGCESICLRAIPHEQKHRQKAFEQIENECQKTAPKSAVHKGVCGAWILILAIFQHIFFSEKLSEYLGVQYAAG